MEKTELQQEALLQRGLNEKEIAESRAKYGLNLITPPKTTPWWRLYLEKFEDPIIVILLVATLISLVFGVIHGNFTESVGIIVAVLIATGVGFWQEYSAKRKFDAMRSDRDYELVTVRREGKAMEITKDQLVVGDVVLLSAGDEVPADIQVLKATDLKASEASMTGESLAVSKYPLAEAYHGSGFAPNLLLRGTTLEEGLGEGIVLKVGDATEIGKTTKQASEETANVTPLQKQLNGLAARINVAAFGIAILMLIILNLTHWDFAWGSHPFTWSWATALTEIRFLMSAVVVIIVAIPEGLPLSVTLALAFSMRTMAKENNLVKKMHACETIGAVDLIFTDKTGTLTQNRMTVVDKEVREPEGVGELALVAALNSTVEWTHSGEVLGNPTEAALLHDLGQQASMSLRQQYLVTNRIPFASSYKYMVTEVQDQLSAETKLLIKGAPEILSRLIGDDSFLPIIASHQERGRRCLSAAIADLPFEQAKELLETGESLPQARYVGSWFIEDPVRPDVPHAIMKCQGSGIDVVMMTGDNLKTASEIARQAGLSQIWAIEAKDFQEAIQAAPSHRRMPNVIARCTPSDKLHILHWAQSEGYVCAMTGDGVNDSPSLNHADVGIAMGSGTSVAKEAADIVLLDDAFPSIVTGVKWGRSLYKNIRNFLYFQLSINVSACLLALFAPIIGVEIPFTVTQFLWINLVMDSFAAMALASEPAEEGVLLEQPRSQSEFIIHPPLAKAIFGFGGLTWLLCTLILWGMNHLEVVRGWGLTSLTHFLTSMDLTIFFAGYMTLNLWNTFNARVMGKNKSAFSGLGRNPRFLGIILLVLVVTIVIVQAGGEVFNTHPLSARTWGWIIVATSPILLVREGYYWLRKLA